MLARAELPVPDEIPDGAIRAAAFERAGLRYEPRRLYMQAPPPRPGAPAGEQLLLGADGAPTAD